MVYRAQVCGARKVEASMQDGLQTLMQDGARHEAQAISVCTTRKQYQYAQGASNISMHPACQKMHKAHVRKMPKVRKVHKAQVCNACVVQVNMQDRLLPGIQEGAQGATVQGASVQDGARYRRAKRSKPARRRKRARWRTRCAKRKCAGWRTNTQ